MSALGRELLPWQIPTELDLPSKMLEDHLVGRQHVEWDSGPGRIQGLEDRPLRARRAAEYRDLSAIGSQKSVMIQLYWPPKLLRGRRLARIRGPGPRASSPARHELSSESIGVAEDPSTGRTARADAWRFGRGRGTGACVSPLTPGVMAMGRLAGRSRKRGWRCSNGSRPRWTSAPKALRSGTRERPGSRCRPLACSRPVSATSLAEIAEVAAGRFGRGRPVHGRSAHPAPAPAVGSGGPLCALERRGVPCGDQARLRDRVRMSRRPEAVRVHAWNDRADGRGACRSPIFIRGRRRSSAGASRSERRWPRTRASG